MYIIDAEIMPETGKVTTHESTTPPKTFQSIPSPDFTVLTPTTLPI